jgi:hypothetical protein
MMRSHVFEIALVIRRAEDAPDHEGEGGEQLSGP